MIEVVKQGTGGDLCSAPKYEELGRVSMGRAEKKLWYQADKMAQPAGKRNGPDSVLKEENPPHTHTHTLLVHECTLIGVVKVYLPYTEPRPEETAKQPIFC